MGLNGLVFIKYIKLCWLKIFKKEIRILNKSKKDLKLAIGFVN